jgi:hypothetical protein
VAGGSNGGINCVNAIEGAGVVKARAASEVELGGAGSGRRWWRRGRARVGRR